MKINVSENIKKRINEWSNLPNRKDHILKLSGLGLTELPKELLDMQDKCIKDLRSLDLGNNKIKEVSPRISELYQLKRLGLAGNLIEDLPNSLNRLETLSVLFLKKNKIKEISSSITSISALVDLDLGYNQIKEIPVEIQNLKHLKCFVINNNELECLASHLFELKRLRDLDISFNKISKIPSSIVSTNLKCIDIINNPITEISPKISDTGLELYNNLIAELPKMDMSIINFHDYGLMVDYIAISYESPRNGIDLLLKAYQQKDILHPEWKKQRSIEIIMSFVAYQQSKIKKRSK